MQFPAYIMKILYRSHDCRSNFFVSFKLQNSICYSALLNISILWKQAATEAPWNYSISFCQLTRHTYFCAGEMAERSNAAVLKTVEVKASGGSNPSLSAKSMNVLRKQAFLFWSLAKLAWARRRNENVSERSERTFIDLKPPISGIIGDNPSLSAFA